MTIKITLEKYYLVSNTHITKTYKMQDNQTMMELELGFLVKQVKNNNHQTLHLFNNNKQVGIAKPLLNNPDKIVMDMLDMSLIFIFEVENA